MVDYCRKKFEYTPKIREPTDQEWAIMIAILEGELLIRHLPQFLRRVCNEDNLFRFQNTIAAQVEGELVGQLADFTQIYKDHQTTGRIVEATLQAARFRKDNKMDEIMAMLRDLKAAKYNDSTHSLEQMGESHNPVPMSIGTAEIGPRYRASRESKRTFKCLEQTIGS
uniref:Uncharacterized protein n=1 Tax=Globisporangium ultimum (strain ATCC 200006 / CBS 805.95 / DAOM BR144) TaxID=431595 RepID=K3WC38_GLOUD